MRLGVPRRILGELELIGSSLGKCTDWIYVKSVLLRSIPPELRQLFSTRDPITKKHTLNDFEQELIDIYLKETGIQLKIRDEQRLENVRRKKY